MATLAVTGRMTLPNSPGGSTTPIIIGTPEVTPDDSDTGVEVTYAEKVVFEYTIAPAGIQPVNFGTVADGKFVYVGTDKAVTYKVNGGTEVFNLAEGGFIMWNGATLTALEITNPGVLDANVYVLIVGE